MSRRDIVVNTLLGLLLLTAALLLFLVFLAVFGLAFWALGQLAERLVPGMVLPYSLALLVIYGIWSLIYGAGHLRREHWRNAFLCLAMIPVIVSIWLANPHSPFGRDGFLPIWLVLMVLFTPGRSLVPRSEFFLNALIASAVVVVNSGLVGSNLVVHALSNCTLLAAVVSMVIQVRRSQAGSENQHSASPSVA